MKWRLRARDWVLVVALTGSWAVFFARAVDEGLHTGRGRVNVSLWSAAARDAYPTVRDVPSRDWNRGLEPGDEILSAAGEDLAGRSAIYFFERTTRIAVAQEGVPLRIRRGDTIFETHVELTPTPDWWLLLAVSAANMALALLLLVRVPGSHLTRRYLVAMWALSVAGALAPYLVAPRTVFEGVLRCFLPATGNAVMVWMAQDFTLSARPVPWRHRALVGLVFLLFFAFFMTLGFLPDWGPSIVQLGVLVHVVFIAAAVAGLTRAYRRSEPIERRQTRWVFLGAYVAGIAVLLNTWTGSVGAPHVVDSTLNLITALALPIGIVVSVTGYGWLDVDRLISATASYTVVGLAVLGGVLALIPGLAQAAAPAVGLDASTGQWALTMGLVGAAIPAHRFLRPRIDRRLFAERHARMRGLEQLVDEIGRCTTVEELTRLPGERLDALLAPESIAIYGREEELFTPLFVRGRAAPPAFEADSPLLNTLTRRARPLAADAAGLDAFDRAALETLGTSVVVPTRRADAVVAFTCLGPKRSGDIYTPEEIAYLTAITRSCSEALTKFEDEVVIREAREMQRALRRYVPGAVAERVLRGDALEPAELEVTVLFVDIRGYTGVAERLAAKDVFETLNEHTERVSRIVQESRGTIVEFNGDGMMAVFGAPEALAKKEQLAVEAARRIVDSMPDHLAVGVGVATGPAFVGSIRSTDRLIWSAVGSTTNLASRLQSLTRELGASIAIDDTTRERARYVCADFARHENLEIRGRQGRFDVFALPLR